jgi:hypothetical protein
MLQLLRRLVPDDEEGRDEESRQLIGQKGMLWLLR